MRREKKTERIFRRDIALWPFEFSCVRLCVFFLSLKYQIYALNSFWSIRSISLHLAHSKEDSQMILNEFKFKHFLFSPLVFFLSSLFIKCQPFNEKKNRIPHLNGNFRCCCLKSRGKNVHKTMLHVMKIFAISLSVV